MLEDHKFNKQNTIQIIDKTVQHFRQNKNLYPFKFLLSNIANVLNNVVYVAALLELYVPTAAAVKKHCTVGHMHISVQNEKAETLQSSTFHKNLS